MNTFTITSQEQFNNTLSFIGDLYKDAYGFRNRAINWTAFTWDELAGKVNELSAMIDQENEMIAKEEELAIKRVMSTGVSRKTAKRWLKQAETYSLYGDY